MNKKTVRNTIFLICTALIWGVAFVAQKEGGEAVGPYTFNCVRMVIGAMVLLPVIGILDKAKLTSRKPVTRKDWKQLIFGGLCCGASLCIASIFQQLGLNTGASAGKAGFLTACYILIVPILGLFIKKKCSANIWFGVIIALVGMYLLCIKDGFDIAMSDILLIICSFLFSIQILFVDYFSPRVDGVRLSCIQFLIGGVIAAIPMFVIDMSCRADMTNWLSSFKTIDAWIPILYAGIMSCGVAYTFQIIGQNGLNPTIASLIMSLESVFSAIAGAAILNERMSNKEIIGCVLIFLAIVIAQIPIKKNNKV